MLHLQVTSPAEPTVLYQLLVVAGHVWRAPGSSTNKLKKSQVYKERDTDRAHTIDTLTDTVPRAASAALHSHSHISVRLTLSGAQAGGFIGTDCAKVSHTTVRQGKKPRRPGPRAPGAPHIPAHTAVWSTTGPWRRLSPHKDIRDLPVLSVPLLSHRAGAAASTRSRT